VLAAGLRRHGPIIARQRAPSYKKATLLDNIRNGIAFNRWRAFARRALMGLGAFNRAAICPAVGSIGTAKNESTADGLISQVA